MILIKKRSFNDLVIISFIFSLLLPRLSLAKIAEASLSEAALFNNLPRVALLVKENYVEPERINPSAMLVAILGALELRISRLVVTLPKSLEEIEKLPDELNAQTTGLIAPIGPKMPPKEQGKSAPSLIAKSAPEVKEKIILKMGSVEQAFDFESKRSMSGLWGMIFLLRDMFKFIETEGNKQGLAKSNSQKEEPLEWEKLEYAAINAMLGTLDPHSVFLEPKFARDLTLTTQGAFGGVGIVIGIDKGFLTVVAPIDDTPAFKVGVKAKDRIIKINDRSAINMDLHVAVDLLRGKPNTNVKITVQRTVGNSTINKDFDLKRAIIKVDSVAYALLDEHVGYLRIKAFQGKTADDVRAAILDMKQKSKNSLQGVVLDLRDNPGGLLREAVQISDLFLNGGEVVSTQGAAKESRQVEMATSGEIDENLKIAVLVNGGSASAAEIVAGALKYRDRGIVIGSSTFGKGSVQMVFDFPPLANANKKPEDQPVEPAALKLTIAQYFAPAERTIQTVGIKPDIELHEVNVAKKEEISLFADNISVRESDLSAHLLAADSREEEESLLKINYLAQIETDKTTEYGKLNKEKLAKDFAVTVAADFILKAQGNSRLDLLKNTKEIGDRLSEQQKALIAKGLKVHGIDWSVGTLKKDNKVSVQSFISKNKVTEAGSKLTVALKVKNTSKEPLYQVYAITHAKTPLFDQRELLFGKIEPGKEIEREVQFDIPKDVISRKDLFSVEIKDSSLEKISELDVPIEIAGLKRPAFAYLVFLEDSKGGNGDGHLQQGEEVEMVVWLKNVGQGKAFEPTVLLRSESDDKIFLEKGRDQAGELLPNQETAFKFSFRVKEKTDSAKFEIQIFDEQMHDIWRDKVSFNFEPKASSKIISEGLSLKEKSIDLLYSPRADSAKIAILKEGIKFKAVKDFGDYYLAKINNNLSGFVKKSSVKQAKFSQKELNTSKDLKLIELNYMRIPPKLELSFGDGLGFTQKNQGQINAKIFDANKVREVLIYLNGKKVLYQKLLGQTNEEKISHQVVLKPGVNIISLLANEDAFFGQKENITVYFDEKKQMLLPISKSPTSASNKN